MSYKKATYLVLGLLVALAALYFWTAINLRDPRTRGTIGPGYFPVILSVLLVVLCAISFVQTWRSSEDKVITIPNLGLVSACIGLTALFLVAWRMVDGFYALSFAFVLVLMTLFAPGRGLRQLAVNTAAALVLTGAIYGLFGYVMQVRF